MTISQWNFPTTIRFGPGARFEVQGALADMGSDRPLIVTDAGIRKLSIFDELWSHLCEGAGESRGELDIGVYSEFQGNPLESHVTAGVETFKAHDADAIVALGGGAALDVAKAIALMANHPGSLFDYEDGKPDARPVDRHVPPIIGIPTTAGTGSEVGRSTVISTDDTHEKKIMFSPLLLPGMVFADPELLVDLPPKLTAATGADALTHNVEAYLAKGNHPMADGIALEGVRLVARSLEKSVEDGRDLDARSDMLAASIMGAVAFQKGLGVTHSLAHALSTVTDMHHGLANAIMLPVAMQYNAKEVPERLAALARAASVGSNADDFIEWLVELRERIGIPATLSAAGVRESQIDDLADVAIEDACHPFNPRPVTRADIVSMYEAAM